VQTVEFTTAVSITSMDIYTASAGLSTGTAETLRLFSDNGGQPGTLLDSLSETVTTIDTLGIPATGWTGHVRDHTQLVTPLVLQANTVYWIGLSGTTQDIGLDTFAAGPHTPPGTLWLAARRRGSRFRAGYRPDGLPARGQRRARALVGGAARARRGRVGRGLAPSSPPGGLNAADHR
jgi:hypothetical protein